MDGDAQLRPGDQITLGVDVGAAYLFDPDSGLALPYAEAKLPVPA